MKDRRVSLVVLGFVLAVLISACGQTDAAAEGETAYHVSTSATEEILSFGWYGGSGDFVPQYRLHGDGRLVREIVYQGDRKTVKTSAEAQLSLQDIDLLMQLCVESQLAELTPRRLRQAIGQEPLRMHDGGTALLRLRFMSYQRPGEEEEAPFNPQIEMHAPQLQLRFFPEVREVQAMVALEEALDGYFSQSATEALYGRKKDRSE